MKINEKQLNNIIKKAVRESIESFGAFNQFESDSDEKETKKSDGEGKADINNETEEEQEKRSSVETYFKDPHMDVAQYAYDLEGIKPKEGEDTNEMKNARSLFMKKLNHEPNDDGYPYSFSTMEINRLFSLMSSSKSSNSISESKVRKEFWDIYNKLNNPFIY